MKVESAHNGQVHDTVKGVVHVVWVWIIRRADSERFLDVLDVIWVEFAKVNWAGGLSGGGLTMFYGVWLGDRLQS